MFQVGKQGIGKKPISVEKPKNLSGAELIRKARAQILNDKHRQAQGTPQEVPKKS